MLRHVTNPDAPSMMLVVPHSLDVIPGRGLVASIALVHLSRAATLRHLSIFLPGNPFRDHVEVHHIVTWRRLVTLGAIKRARRGMAKSGDGPLCRPVALRTVGSKKTAVAIFGAVAARTVQCHFQRCHRRLVGQRRRHGDLADPGHQLIGGLLLLTIRR